MCDATTVSQSVANVSGCGAAHAAEADGDAQVREDAQTSNDARASTRLPYVALALWGLLAFAVPAISQALNLVDLFAFPLGYLMVAQGSLIGFVLIGLISARWQDRRDARRAMDS